MGFFSWKTSDTDRSIANRYSDRDTFKVHLITRDGQVYTEDSYDGYGRFGGKDFYELVATLNGKKGREEGIELAFGRNYITDGKVRYYDCGRDFISWDQPLLKHKSPNELLKEGWAQGKEYNPDVVLPKLVQSLPPEDKWEEYFDNLPDSENCEYQGFFYGY